MGEAPYALFNPAPELSKAEAKEAFLRRIYMEKECSVLLDFLPPFLPGGEAKLLHKDVGIDHRGDYDKNTAGNEQASLNIHQRLIGYRSNIACIFYESL